MSGGDKAITSLGVVLVLAGASQISVGATFLAGGAILMALGLLWR